MVEKRFKALLCVAFLPHYHHLFKLSYAKIQQYLRKQKIISKKLKNLTKKKCFLLFT